MIPNIDIDTTERRPEAVAKSVHLPKRFRVLLPKKICMAVKMVMRAREIIKAKRVLSIFEVSVKTMVMRMRRSDTMSM